MDIFGVPNLTRIIFIGILQKLSSLCSQKHQRVTPNTINAKTQHFSLLSSSKATAVSNEPAWVCFSAIWGFFPGSSPGGPNQGFLHLSGPAQAN